MVKPEFCGKRLKNELVQEKISKSFPCAIFLALFMILVCVFFFLRKYYLQSVVRKRKLHGVLRLKSFIGNCL